MITRLLLIALYPLVLAARIGFWLRGRDPLRLREPKDSCWVERPAMPSAHSYFSEESGNARESWLTAVLTRLARTYAPQSATTQASTPDRALPDEIPDEVYTLW